MAVSSTRISHVYVRTSAAKSDAVRLAADLLINPPERVELYSNRIVVRLHREGKFLIPLKDVAGVEQVDNPFKTFCQPAFMHTRPTQMSSSVYIQSKSKGVAPHVLLLALFSAALLCCGNTYVRHSA